MSDELTFEDFINTFKVAFPPLYYATMEECGRGQVYYVKEGKFHPEYIVFHPLDFNEIKGNIRGRRLIHIKDYPPPNTC